jgi:hypothetical protein
VDGSGRFYKPLQDGERGSREKKFYESFWTDDTIPDTVKSVFPFYYGTSQIEASDGSGLIDILNYVFFFVLARSSKGEFMSLSCVYLHSRS